ncbi:hypothetical protein D3C85_1179860 [compost metagenome]
MEEADIEAVGPAHLRHPANGHEAGADQLGYQGEQHYALHQLDDVDRALLTQRLLGQHLLAQADPLAEHGDQQQGHGHLAKAADLHQHQQEDLPLQGEDGAGIHHPEAGHADGRGGGEQGVDEGDFALVAGGLDQEQGADQQDDEETAEDQPGFAPAGVGIPMQGKGIAAAPVDHRVSSQ